jgi:16S rRNA (guanine1207-N2)-methyltransferase
VDTASGRSVDEDAALDTLLLPFANQVLHWPDGDRVLFLRARASRALPPFATLWTCEQSFKPFADTLTRAGLKAVAEAPKRDFDLVLVLPTRQREESRALLAKAMQHVSDDGVVVASVLNTEGSRTSESDLAKLAGEVHSLSKNKCRVFWTNPERTNVDTALVSQWAELDAPRPIADGDYLSRPGLFAWDRIDAASALLAANLPNTLSGRGADLGAGFGYLAAQVMDRCPKVSALDLFEAEARALALARDNLSARMTRLGHVVRLGFHWHDVTRGLPGRYDFIVSNPPFHQGRADQPDLGRAFISAAAAALRPGGSLYLVANRHLPYEATLAQGFATARVLEEASGFKVIEAIKAKA